MDRQGYTDASLKKPDIGTINYGVWSGGIYTDLSQGSFQKTDNPLDLAIDGNGFFAVQSGNRVLYTRDGRFTRGSNGLLVTTEGMPVLGVNGVINLPQGQVTVNPNGDIYVNGNYVDTLRLVDINGGNGGAITKFGDNLITGPIGNRPVGGFARVTLRHQMSIQ